MSILPQKTQDCFKKYEEKEIRPLIPEIRFLLEELNDRQVSQSPESIHYSVEPVDFDDPAKGILKYFTIIWKDFFVVFDVSEAIMKQSVTFFSSGKIVETKSIQEMVHYIIEMMGMK